MASSTLSIRSTLRAKIDVKIQDALSHDSPKSAFINIWLQLKDDYEAMRQDLNLYLSRQLDQNRIRATLHSRIKTLESIKKSIDRRESSRIGLGGGGYESPKEIFDDVHDLVGFRIVVDYLSGLEDSYAMIDKTFRKEREPHVFSSDRQVGQLWKPRFGAYEAQNYQVRLDPKYNTELPIYNGVLFEIQVISVAESLYNKLAHPLLYKGSTAGLSRKEEMMIDLSHGLALCYWITLSSMEDRLESKKEDNSQGVHRQSQLPDAVRKAAALDQTEEYMDDLVDITPNVQSISQARQPQSLGKSSSLQRDASSGDRISRETLLYSLFDPSESIHPDEEFWAKIRSKLGLSGGTKEPPIVLPTVFEACFDSEDLRRSPHCDENTRTEVRAMIREWVDDTNAETLLWLHAPAGTGKSTLARTLVNDFEHEKRLAAGYFFKRGDDLRNDTARVFTTIASQLIKTVPLYEHFLRQSLEISTVDGIEKRSLEKQFETLIYNPLDQLCCLGGGKSPMIVIIDALDECTRQGDIDRVLKLFASLKCLDPFRLCVFFSSRRTPPLLDAFGDIPETDARCRVLALHEQFLEATRKEMGVVLANGLAKIKKRRRIRQEPWPTARQFAFVLNQATNPSPLFIYISTLLLHINNGNAVQRFNNWVRGCQDNVSQLDQIYMPIITAILEGEDGDGYSEPLNDEECAELRHILGSLVLLAKPLPAKGLQSLLGLDEDCIRCWLGALHAVIHAPDDDKSPVELIHKSFADFLLGEDETGTDSFRIDASEFHGMLAERCMSRLNTGLRKNLCNVPTLAIKAKEIDKDIITTRIPHDLEYACVYWLYHLVRSKKTIGEEMIRSLRKEHLLHWFETLSLLGKLLDGEEAIRMLLDLSLVLNHQASLRLPGDSMTNFLKDAQELIRERGRTIQRYPLQVYCSCLMLSPQKSRVREHFVESSDLRIASFQNIKGGPIPQDTTTREFRMDGAVHQVAFSPNGHWATANIPGVKLDVVDIKTGAFHSRLRIRYLETERIIALSFSTDGKHIITLAQDGEVHLWDTTGQIGEPTLKCILASSDPEHKFDWAAISAEFSLIATIEENSLILWDFETGDCYCTLRDDVLKDVCDIALIVKSQTEWMVGLITQAGRIYLVNSFKGIEPTIFYVGNHFSSGGRGAIAISPCGNLLVSGIGEDLWLWKWNETEGFHLHTIERNYRSAWIAQIAFSPDGKSLAAAGAFSLTISRIGAQFNQQTLHEPPSLPGNGRIVSSTLFDHKPHANLGVPYAHILNPSRVKRMVLARNQRTLVTTSETHPLLIWDVEQGILLHDIPLSVRVVCPFTVSLDGGMLVVQTTEQHLQFWRLDNSTATPQKQKIVLEPSSCVSQMGFSPDSKTLVLHMFTSLGDASNDERWSFSLWDIAAGECRWCLNDLEFHPELWEFSPDAATLLVASYQTVQMLDSSTGDCRASVSLRAMRYESHVNNLSFSTNGELVGIRTEDPESRKFQYRLWDVQSGTIQPVDSLSQNDPRLKRAYGAAARRQNWISDGLQAVCFIRDWFSTIAVSWDRVVIAQKDGELMVVDFDPARVNEI
ncbi:hypothetical protein FDECE_7164 [Fusarium decemcellulare]|nr:hypothetical protein FDECE_7164 [Fusarium decemcellulare]